MHKNQIMLSGLSSILGGFLYGILGVAWAITHGSTGTNRQGTWLGIDNLSFSKMNIIFVILFIVGFLGLKWAAAITDKKSLIAYKIIVFSLFVQLVAQILQYYIINPLIDWEHPIISIGFQLHNLSWLLFIIGTIYFSIRLSSETSILRTTILLFALSLIVLFMASVVIFPMFGTGSLLWDVFLGIVKFPFALSWVLFGTILLIRSTNGGSYDVNY